MISQVLNIDCMEYMCSLPDGFADLAIVDPMYDLATNYLCHGSDISTTGVKRKYIKQANKLSKLNIVDEAYFKELKRISKHQIVWGENYFNYNEKPFGRIIWDKVNDSSSFSNAEIASCTLLKGVRIFRFMWNGMLQQNMKNKENRIHPFQKPIALYKWLLKKYAEPGWKILDTHLGSGSIRIAAYDLGYDFYGVELDKESFDAQEKRFANHVAQQRLFAPTGKPAVEQIKLL